jgi:hypothetical protein
MTSTRNVKKDGVKKGKRLFPKVTLEEALAVAQVLKDKNGGNPWPPKDLASALELSQGNKFFYLTSAAQLFGITNGTRDAAQISLSELGRAIVYAPNGNVEVTKKQEAFFNVPLYKKVFDYYKGNNLPEAKYVENTMVDRFGLTRDTVEEFVKLFVKDCNYLGYKAGTESSTIQSVNPDKGRTKSSPESTVTLSQASAGDAKVVFVIMPFSEHTPTHTPGFFQEVLSSLITPAVAEAGFTVKTARRDGSDVIQSTIINELLSADLVVGDLTEHNPNVLFELGVRMALEKPVLLIKTNDTARIFDVDNMLRVYDYSPNLWPSTLEKDIPALTKQILAAWESRNERTYMSILKSEK